MRKAPPEKLEAGRLVSGSFASPRGEMFGAFFVHGPTGCELKIIASDGLDSVSAGWEHVSVSTPRRTPNWQEMSFAKDLFWTEEECVVQFHPPQSVYVNNHPHCLHLWRNKTQQFPIPPSILVGLKSEGLLTRVGELSE